jgi:hypothetical protein
LNTLFSLNLRKNNAFAFLRIACFFPLIFLVSTARTGNIYGLLCAGFGLLSFIFNFNIFARVHPVIRAAVFLGLSAGGLIALDLCKALTVPVYWLIPSVMVNAVFVFLGDSKKRADSIPKSFGEMFVFIALNYAVFLLSSILKEFLWFGKIFGVEMPVNPNLPAGSYYFVSFILLGVFIAALSALSAKLLPKLQQDDFEQDVEFFDNETAPSSGSENMDNGGESAI